MHVMVLNVDILNTTELKHLNSQIMFILYHLHTCVTVQFCNFIFYSISAQLSRNQFMKSV